jgi:hypothetical protein
MPADDADLIKAGAQGIVEGAMEPFSDLIQKLFGPAAEEAGLMLKDSVHRFRVKRLIRFFQGTTERFANAKFEQAQVSLKLLSPIIENASLEEDDNLQDIWANLLANAADPDQRNGVYPSFPAMLKELTARDVKYLDALFIMARELGKGAHRTVRVEDLKFDPRTLQAVYKRLGFEKRPNRGVSSTPESRLENTLTETRAARLSLDTFERQGIVVKVYEAPIRESGRNTFALGMGYSFTSLGACFVMACRSPRDDT